MGNIHDQLEEINGNSSHNSNGGKHIFAAGIQMA